jgi:dTDP-glucose 4,6-dehydratase
MNESHPLQGQSPYSASKIGADQLAYSFFTSFNVPVVTVRPFNTYGPRQSARAVIPTIITQIANGAKKIDLGSISPTRDFSYIDDTTTGFIAALESQNGIGETVNLGTNFEISILETASLIARLMDAEIQIESTNERSRPKKSEVERLCADNSKAKELFGWAPSLGGIAGLSHGLEKTISLYNNQSNLSTYKSDRYNV